MAEIKINYTLWL